MRILLIAALLAATPAVAQEQDLMRAYRSVADTCWARVADGGDITACDGLLSEACMEGEPGGMSTMGMAGCIAAEVAWWDEKLNDEWPRVMAAARERDEADREYAPGYAVRAEKLRAAQRAWIAFRDAECGFQYSIPGDGSLRSIYWPSCVSTMTMERLEDLRAIRAELNG